MDLHRTLSLRTLLCIGSDAEARELVGRSLRAYVLVFAGNARDALCSLNTRAFDGYVSDYWLSDWTGPQLCRAIRDLDPHCPVIFFTAATGHLHRSRAMRAGASAYCSRDGDGETLDAAVRRLIAAADARSLAAKAYMEQAVLREVERCTVRAASNAAKAELPYEFVERRARKRARSAFVEAGGCLAHFDRWWPHVFASAQATCGALPA